MSQKAIPIIDFDALITAINALSAPSGTDVAISPTGMHIVTEDDVQGAISELDAGLYATNSSLTQKIVIEDDRHENLTVSINSGASWSATYTTPTKAGYTLGGIIGVRKAGTNHSGVSIAHFAVTSAGLSIGLFNSYSATANITTIVFTLLWIKD